MNLRISTGPALVAPALIGLVVFVLLPFLMSIGISLTNLRIGSPLPLEFVGLEQYIRIFDNPAFQKAVLNNVTFALITVPLQTVFALLLALLLNKKLYASSFFRTIFFAPVVFPLSLVSVVWITLYAPGPDGTINAVLKWLSFGAWEAEDFLHSKTWAMPAIILPSIWQGAGFQMVIILSGVQAIPRHLYEIASIDGANSWQQFWCVTLPQLRDTIIFVLLVSTVLASRLFDQVQIMTQGGPDNATTTVMYEAVRTSFNKQQVAAGSAMTVVLFAFVLSISILQRRFVKVKEFK